MTTATKYLHVGHAAELYSKDGPTGDVVEVIRGQLRDYGGNVHFEGTADECIAEEANYRIRLRRTPTEWRKVDGEILSADNHWNLVVEN